MIVVDTSVWIDFFNGAANPERETLRELLRQDPTQLLLPDLVLYEVLSGFRHEREKRLAEATLSSLVVAVVGGEPSALRAAERYRQLRASGITVRSSVDVLIASHCIDRDLILLQRDRDFLPFEQTFGLRLLRPLH